MWPEVLPHLKKSLYNQPEPYCFQKIIVKSFLIDFNKFHTKTFRIVYMSGFYLYNILVDYIGIFFYMWQYFWPHTCIPNYPSPGHYVEKKWRRRDISESNKMMMDIPKQSKNKNHPPPYVRKCQPYYGS